MLSGVGAGGAGPSKPRAAYNPPIEALVRFKIATESCEFDQIAGLLYRTFVEEIPQHPANPDRRHVDRFHDENLYLVAVEGDAVVGTIAVRDRRPFSLDEKLGPIDGWLPQGRRVCELRLLAVEPEHRRGSVFRGLVDLVVREGRGRGYDLAIISGTTRQTRLYQRLGFEPFGQLVGTSEAPFLPMFLPFEKFLARAPAIVTGAEPISFLPGPVPIAPEVRTAFAAPPKYHRDDEFRIGFERLSRRLCALAQASQVQVLLGSGTLANDAVAGQIALMDAPGVVVSNGEFGRRLIDHARRHRLAHEAIDLPWGRPIELDVVRRAAWRMRARWIWAVASETSTGMLNDAEALQAVAHDVDAVLCLDCVSAIGAVPLDLRGVHLASGASGKALASYPGISFVFHAEAVEPAPDRLPRYLDLGYYASKGGVPFTHSSNLLAALDAALARFNSNAPFAEMAALAARVRPRLRELGWPPLVPDAQATPAVVTVALENGYRARVIGDRLRAEGLVVAHHSDYLAERNWFQVSLMGQRSQASVDCLMDALERCRHQDQVQGPESRVCPA
jgi:aspartate aminotransferase-like enzyme/predicted N-acetyltransferase YhbS